MDPALVLAVGVDAALQRFEVSQEISMRQHDAARLARGSGCVENLGDRASRGCITRVYISLQRGRRAGHDIFEIIDDHRWWRAGKLRLLPVAQDELDPRVCDDALNEIGRRCRIHRHHDGTAQSNSPKTRNPPSGIGPPEENAVPGRDSVASESVTPE